MALNPTSSLQYVAELDYQNKKAGLFDTGLRCAYGKVTCTEAGQGTITMFTLPPGRLQIIPHLSRVVTTGTMVSTADLHIGHGAYVKQDGTAVVADDNEWVDNADSGGGAIDAAFTATLGPGDGSLADKTYNSKSGIPVQAMIDTANMSLTNVIEVWCVYKKEGSA